ncbi:hypothetical protein L5515_017577 [Caenorhabditis briggsae]|uniref:Uncharacterized protein n=1 Tax=Caenorhabditis briggsae TaxID=6238 RepID=A0AAE9FH82_CAEBR|nr:hypothetical protein L5515_017577 [Caenorhabditis briggsae]
MHSKDAFRYSGQPLFVLYGVSSVNSRQYSSFYFIQFAKNEASFPEAKVVWSQWSGGFKIKMANLWITLIAMGS